MGKTIRLTLSKTEVEKIGNKWFYKVIKREEFFENKLGEKIAVTKKDPKWFSRYLELKNELTTDFEIARQLNEEGYTAKQGGPITESAIRSKLWAKRKKIQK